MWGSPNFLLKFYPSFSCLMYRNAHINSHKCTLFYQYFSKWAVNKLENVQQLSTYKMWTIV